MGTLAAETGSQVASTTEQRSTRLPGLDVVRGIAIAMVVVYHGLTPHLWVFAAYPEFQTGLWAGVLRGALQMGGMGVQLFFVLSGCLITGVLIDSRSTPDYFRNFYWRRALRIVPAYVVMLAVLWGTHAVSGRFVLVGMLYLCNVSAIFGVGHEYGPLWSLSVEEQFYLVWPLVVRRTSRTQLMWVCVALLVLTPMLRLGLLYGPAFLQDIRYKTWAVMDFFAAGGLLAIAVRSREVRSKLFRVALVCITAGIALFVMEAAMPVAQSVHMGRMMRAVEPEPWLIVASGLVLMGMLGSQIAGVWALRPLIFLAYISYGLYLCHQFVFYRVDERWHLNPASSLGLLPQLLLRFAVEAAVAIGFAALSRYTMEEFFLRLKPKHKVVTLDYSVATKIT